MECAASRLQLLNPRVQISTHTDSKLLEDEAFLNNFDLVVLVDQDANTIVSFFFTSLLTLESEMLEMRFANYGEGKLILLFFFYPFPFLSLSLSPLRSPATKQLKLNTLTRKLQKKFFASGSIGIHGYVFSDLLSHSYIM